MSRWVPSGSVVVPPLSCSGPSSGSSGAAGADETALPVGRAGGEVAIRTGVVADEVVVDIDQVGVGAVVVYVRIRRVRVVLGDDGVDQRQRGALRAETAAVVGSVEDDGVVLEGDDGGAF